MHKFYDAAFLVSTPFGVCLKMHYKEYELSIAFETPSSITSGQSFFTNDFKVYNEKDEEVTAKIFKCGKYTPITFSIDHFIKALKYIDTNEIDILRKDEAQQFSMTEITPQYATRLLKSTSKITGTDYNTLRKIADTENGVMLSSGAILTCGRHFNSINAKKATKAYFVSTLPVKG